jgi:hypothetical protein
MVLRRQFTAFKNQLLSNHLCFPAHLLSEEFPLNNFYVWMSMVEGSKRKGISLVFVSLPFNAWI